MWFVPLHVAVDSSGGKRIAFVNLWSPCGIVNDAGERFDDSEPYDVGPHDVILHLLDREGKRYGEALIQLIDDGWEIGWLSRHPARHAGMNSEKLVAKMTTELEQMEFALRFNHYDDFEISAARRGETV